MPGVMLGNIARCFWFCSGAVYTCTLRTVRTHGMGETVFEAEFAIFSLLTAHANLSTWAHRIQL